ncbi:Ig-like domain-containing protein [Rheinheimera soli]|uniref:Ig-like domain-containing protein n=1 Tax=Rheinheimera soli TaxID=443616 RepID=UPI001E3F37C7|nr:Ig-like domain-containing protein [Rheinheimera soli]
MRLALLREFFRCWLVFTLCVLLAACGGSGGESGSDSPSGERPPVSPPVIPPVTPPVIPPVGGTPVEMGLMVAFGYNSLAAGSPLRTDQVQNLAVGNGTATYRFPRSGESISGNLTIAVDVADSDGIARVLVGFNGSEQALVLCDSNCGTSYSQTVTGVNPRNFGLTPGSLRLELWLEDLLGNRVMFDARDIEWLPEPITGVNTSRTDTSAQINWAASGSARRYNLYIAEQPGITPENVLTKTGGRQFLALSQSTLSVANLIANQRYFVLITGVDSSGESLFSQQHVVQPVGAPEFSSPVATPDQFSLNEDTEFRGFLLDNDSHPDGRSFSLEPQAVRLPDNGTLVLNTDGSFIYQPVPDFVGNDSFIYQIVDTQGLAAQALVSLTVLPVNDAPVAQDDSYSLNKNNSLNIAAPGVLNNDFDVDGDRLVVDVAPLTVPAHGSLQLNADGSFSYTPQTNYVGEDFFVYQVTDGQGGSAQARVSLRIEMTNAAPVAQNDSYQVNEDQRLEVNATNGILANDVDPDGDAVTLMTELPTTVKNGQLVLASDGSFLYIPNQDFFGTDSFSYQIKDPAGLVSTATVLLTVIAQNDPPVVQPSFYSVNQGVLLSVQAPGLLAHAFDVDDNNLSLVTTAVAAPAKGVLTLSADGAFSYQPNATATGTDSFSYQVTDPAGAVGTGSVSITIIAAANPPVFSDMTIDVWDDVPQGFGLAQFVVTNTDPDTSISFSLIAGNTQGIFSLTAAGALSVVNPAPLVQLGGASVLLTVRAQNSAGLTAQATVTVRIQSTLVTANNDNYTVAEDQVLSSVVSVLANDVDLKGVGLTASLVTAPAHGVLNLNANGHFSYSPNLNFYGQDSFVYSASNGIRSAQATVLVTVTPVNDSPVLSPATFTFSEAVVQGSVVGQLVWQDAETDQSYSFSILSGDYTQAFSVTNQGQLVVASASALLARGGGSGALYIQITDSAGAAGTALITLNVISAMPVANADSYTVDQDSVLQVNTAAGVLSNDNDPTGLGLTATSVTSGPFYGQLNLNADGSFSYQPNANFYGQDIFHYQVTNGVRTASAAVTITVAQVLPALLANFDAYTLDEDTLLTVTAGNSVLQNDIFDPGQQLSVSLVQAPPYGTLSFNTDGTFTYQPATGSYGAFYFTYRLSQGALTSDAQVELNILPVNAPPVLQDATVTIYDNYVNSQQVLAMTLTDPDPGSYSFEILSGNTGGVFAITSGGVIQVADSSLLDASTTASYSLVVKVTENGDANLTDTATVIINVVAAPTDETTVIADTGFAGGANLALEMMLSGEFNDPVQIIPQSDGRSLVIGNVSNSYQQELFVVRLNPDGSVDPSYADKGLFRNSFFYGYSTEQAVAAVLTSSNELVLLVNYTETNASGFYLMKLNENGLLDYSFGPTTQGYLLCEYSPCDSSDMQATDLLLNHQGNYVVSGVKNSSQAFLFEFADSGYLGGWLSQLSAVKQFDLVRQDSDHNYYGIGQSSTEHIVIARFSSSFVLDSSTFGCTPGCVGYREYDFSLYSSKPYDAVLYNDELYVVGSVTEFSAPTSPDGLFFKLTYDGSLNPGFGNAAGFIQVSGHSGYPLHYQALAVDQSGFYVLTSTAESGGDRVSLSQYNLIGDFMSDQPLAVDGQLKAVDLQSDAAGLWLLNHFSNPNYGATGSVSFNWVGKYQHNTLAADTAFSGDGQRWFNAGFGEDILLGSQRLLLGSQVNKTLFYGYSYSSLNGSYQQAFVGRLTASGALDQSFGNHGLVLLANDQLYDLRINTIAEADSNQLYVAGDGIDENDGWTGFVMRLNQDGTLDNSFANGIFTLTPAAVGSYDKTDVVKLQVRTDGHLLIGAEYSYLSSNTDVVVIQLNTDGSLDAGYFGDSAAGYTIFSEIDTSSATEERLSQMKLDPADGSLVIAGQYKLSTDPQLYIARFSDTGLLMNAANSPSDSFGDAALGYSLMNLVDNSNDYYYYSEYINGLDFDAGRNLVLALSRSFESNDSHYLYRLLQNGLTDNSFNSGMPRLYNSFSNLVPAALKIKKIQMDASGRLLMVGTSMWNDVWVGRVLLDGSGADVGRWDPAFEANSAIYGAHLFTGSSFSSDVFMELTSSKVTLGWSNYGSGGNQATLRQYLFYHYNPGNI